MSNTWLDIAGAVLDSVDTDYDVISGGLNAAKSKYQEKNEFFIESRWFYSLFVRQAWL